MPELHLQRAGDALTLTLGAHSASVPWADVEVTDVAVERMYRDAPGYGRTLFDAAFADPGLRAAVLGLGARERLLLVADDPLAAHVGWEYLRAPDNSLLAAHFNLVRGLPESQRATSAFKPAAPLEIVATLASAIDERQPLDVEGEWKRLVEAVTKSETALRLTRVRPPTLSETEVTLPTAGTTLVHFMGHGRVEPTTPYPEGELAFEDAHGFRDIVKASDFAAALNSSVFLVVLGSCLTAVAADWTPFGNVARGLVRAGVPYALGMRFSVTAKGAQELIGQLFSLLLRGHRVEEAVWRARRALAHSALEEAAWLVGVPVLYTNQREPAPALTLEAGKPAIQPDPAHLAQAFDLTRLAETQHFVGRVGEMKQIMAALVDRRDISPDRPTGDIEFDFLVLHGMGGIGKTALAREVAARVSWRYDDRVLAYSFETFARLEGDGKRVVNPAFAGTFYTDLAQFYGLDPAQHPTTEALQRAILRAREHTRSLLVLDNVETVIDAQKRGIPEAKALAGFVSRLREGAGDILLTTRFVPPNDLGACYVVHLGGLADDPGADLFDALLPADRKGHALRPARVKLSQRVSGHPLAIRLLAGRFAEATGDLEAFLQDIEGELRQAEQTTPASLEDPERQATLYACMAYSVDRLTPAQQGALRAAGVFSAPFTSDYVSFVMDDDRAPKHLQDLVRLGLLEVRAITVADGTFLSLELHPMVRWYVKHQLPSCEKQLIDRYSQLLLAHAWWMNRPESGFDRSPRVRRMAFTSLPDFENAIALQLGEKQGDMAYYLAGIYHRFGQTRRALDLLDVASEIYADLKQFEGLLQAQAAKSDMMARLGDIQDALQTLEQTIHQVQDSVDPSAVTGAKRYLATILRQLGRTDEATEILSEVLVAFQKSGDEHGEAIVRNELARLLRLGRHGREALATFDQAMESFKELGDMRSYAIAQTDKAHLLMELGETQEALNQCEEALRIKQQLGDLREIALGHNEMGHLTLEMGDVYQAEAYYEQALTAFQELHDHRGAAIVQLSLLPILLERDDLQRAIGTAWEAHLALYRMGLEREAETAQGVLISIRRRLGQRRFDAIWTHVTGMPQPGWLRDVESAPETGPARIAPEEVHMVVANTVTVMTQVPEKRGEWREIVAGALAQARNAGASEAAGFFSAVLAILDGEMPSLPEGHPYAGELAAIQDGIASGGLLSAEGAPVAGVSAEVMEAVRAFVNADDLASKRQAVEAQQALLFQPDVEAVFEQNITDARTKGDQERAGTLEMHLNLLRDCKAHGVAEAFARLEAAMQAADALASALAHLPFDVDLISRTVAALRGDPQDKLKLAQELNALHQQHDDAHLRAFVTAIQTALFGGDLAVLGGGLSGVYRALWQAIVDGYGEAGASL